MLGLERGPQGTGRGNAGNVVHPPDLNSEDIPTIPRSLSSRGFDSCHVS
jgi:hypothetical protein